MDHTGDHTGPWRGAGVTDVGRVRPTNQDAFLVSDELGLWIVADGMGGHAGGDVASRIAVETIDRYVRHDVSEAHRAQRHTVKTQESPERLNAAMRLANDAVRDHAAAHPEFTGMGTTVVCILIPPVLSDLAVDFAWIAHAGDSRAYLFRERRLSLLTRDHTVLEEQIEAGVLPASTPASHHLGHVLTRAIGVNATVEPDVSHVKLQPADVILLCSDGLNKMLDDDHIQDTLTAMPDQSPEEMCQALVNQANALGGRDNTTVVLISSPPL